MTAIVDLFRSLLPFIVAGGILLILYHFGSDLAERIMGSKIWGAIAIVGVTLIAAVVVAMVFQPSSVTKLTEFAFGIGRQQREAEAKLHAAVIDPRNNPSSWSNPVAKEAAEAVKTDFSVKIAGNRTEITQEEAKRLSLLPTGHPDRKRWDDVKEDPLSVTGSYLERRVEKKIKEVDWGKVNVSMKAPLGDPSASSSGLVKDISALPSGVGIWAGSLLSLLVLGLFAKLAFR